MLCSASLCLAALVAIPSLVGVGGVWWGGHARMLLAQNSSTYYSLHLSGALGLGIHWQQLVGSRVNSEWLQTCCRQVLWTCLGKSAVLIVQLHRTMIISRTTAGKGLKWAKAMSQGSLQSGWMAKLLARQGRPAEAEVAIATFYEQGSHCHRHFSHHSKYGELVGSRVNSELSLMLSS